MFFVLLLFAQIYIQDTIIVSASPFERYSFFTSPFSSHFTELHTQSLNLNGIPGILTFSGVNYTTLTLGGTTPEQNLVLFDGISLKNPQSGYTDISLIPLSFIHSMEFLHSSSVFYGSQGIGGVINIHPEFGKTLSLRIGTLHRSLKVSSPISRKIFVSFAIEEFVDSFPYTNDFGETQFYRNAGYSKAGILIKSLYPLPFTLLFSERASGAPGPVGSILSGHKKEKLILGGTTLKHGNLTSRISASRYTLLYEAPATEDRHTVYNFNYSGSIYLLYSGFEFEKVISTKINTRKRWTLFAGLDKEINLKWFASRVNIRGDLSSGHTGVFTYSISLFKQWKNIFLFIHGSKNFRLPTFNELYWPEDLFAEGNPELEPETSRNIDAGVRLLSHRFYLNFSLYYKNVHNQILWVSELKWHPENKSEMKNYGIEWEGNYSYKNVLSLNFSGTLFKSLFNGQNFLYRPGITARGTFLFKNILVLEFSYTGERPERPGSTKKLPAFFLVNLKLKKSEVIKSCKFEICVGINNLFDTTYELIRGYPQPGREFYMEVNVKRRTL